MTVMLWPAFPLPVIAAADRSVLPAVRGCVAAVGAYRRRVGQQTTPVRPPVLSVQQPCPGGCLSRAQGTQCSGQCPACHPATHTETSLENHCVIVPVRVTSVV